MTNEAGSPLDACDGASAYAANFEHEVACVVAVDSAVRNYKRKLKGRAPFTSFADLAPAEFRSACRERVAA